MAGSLTIPNVFQTKAGLVAVSLLDDDLSGIATYVNAREITQDILANRPVVGVSGRWYYATDVGTLFADNGTTWVPVAQTTNVPISPAVLPPLSAGTARLTFTSATLISLASGNIPLKVGSVWQNRVISTAITQGVGGLAASTLYYAYATDLNGVTSLTFSTVGHATDATYGVETKTGLDTNTLVGMVRTNQLAQFADSTTLRFVASWFNRKLRSTSSTAASIDTATTTLDTFVAINTRAGNLVEFVSWGDEEVQIAGTAILANNNANGCAFTIGVDANPDNNIRTQLNNGNANQQTPFATMRTSLLIEGYHFTQGFMQSVIAGNTTTAFGLAVQAIVHI